MWACLDWDLTGYKIIIIFWRKCEQEWWSGTRDSEFLDWEMWASLLIRYKRIWIFSKEMWVSSLLISLQDHDSFWRNVTKIEQVTCNKFMVFWRNLSKTSLFDQVLQDQVPNNVSKIDAASKIIDSEQHWEQDWSSYPCGWRFCFLGFGIC